MNKTDSALERNTEERWCNHSCSGGAKIFIIWGFFGEWSIQHAMRMRHVGVCDLPGCTVFFHIINGTIFGGGLLNEKGVFWMFPTTFAWNILILKKKKTERGVIIIVCWYSYKVPLSLPDFTDTLIFSTDFQKNTPMSNLMKIHRMCFSSMRTDRYDEANIAFLQFCELT
jgi:hypothetical protein